MFHFEFAKKNERHGKPLTFQHIPLLVTHKHNNIQTDKVWIPRGMKVHCTVLQTFFHSISNKIKNQLLHWGQKHAGEQVDGLKANAL